MSCGIGCRCGLDPALLWLWCRPVATALIRSLAWILHMPQCGPKKDQKKKKFCCCCCCCLFVFVFFRSGPVAYRSFWARGRVRAAAVGLYHSHSNSGSEPHLLMICYIWDLHHCLWQHQILNPLNEGRGWTQILMDTRFFTY